MSKKKAKKKHKKKESSTHSCAEGDTKPQENERKDVDKHYHAINDRLCCDTEKRQRISPSSTASISNVTTEEARKYKKPVYKLKPETREPGEQRKDEKYASHGKSHSSKKIPSNPTLELICKSSREDSRKRTRDEAALNLKIGHQPKSTSKKAKESEQWPSLSEKLKMKRKSLIKLRQKIGSIFDGKSVQKEETLSKPQSLSKCNLPKQATKDLPTSQTLNPARKEEKNKARPKQTDKTKQSFPSSGNKAQSRSRKIPFNIPAVQETFDDEEKMQVEEELYEARSRRLLEVNMVKSYGDLTGMDIDPPQQSTPLGTEAIQQQVLVVVDTNIFVGHLDYVKRMRSYGFGALGFPIILIPWVVMQELDSLKSGKLSNHAACKARPAVDYIYTCLKNQEPRLWGQSLQQAAESTYGLSAENNDDRVLQCCLQYHRLYPGSALILCTNDKNLCSKALLCQVRALSKADLISEVERLQTQAPSHPSTSDHHPSVSLPTETVSNSGGRFRDADTEGRKLSTCLARLEDILQKALSCVLVAEMEAAFGHLWEEIVILKPPWTLKDILYCFKKHWFAVFGHVVPRSLLNSVEYLIHVLCKGKTMDEIILYQALMKAQDLLTAFTHQSQYSSHLHQALKALETLLHQPCESDTGPTDPPGQSAVGLQNCDTLMVEGEKHRDAHSSHQEVWILFEHIWSRLYSISSEVCATLQFFRDSHTNMLECIQPPLDEAISCLHSLIATIRQLLRAFERVLSVDSHFEDVKCLFTLLSTCQISLIRPSFTAKTLSEVLVHPEYREKLRLGGNQLTEVLLTLEHCASCVDLRTAASSLH